jgi:hypothetical protein
MPRRNNLVPFLAGTGRTIPITERLTIALTPARACRVADFELRTGVKIEQAILDFLDDQIFALTDVPPAPSGEPSTSRE